MNKICLKPPPRRLLVSCLKYSSTFSKANRGSFFQDEPQLRNQYKEDAYLREHLKLVIPKEVLNEIEPDLDRFGERIASEVDRLGAECEKNQPFVEHYNEWGRRVDKLITCEAWNKMKKISAEEGLIAIPYEQKYAQYSRIYQIAKLYMYSPSSGLYSCPLAMTDGAAKTIQTMKIPSFTREAYSRLTSRDTNVFWTSGQWMTERKGGSDVAGGTETVATEIDSSKNLYQLNGYKWFSSATDADMSITLARVKDKNGNTVQGTKGLTMFFLTLRDEQNQLNGIEIHRLKNKLGTRQLPTAELLLDGTKAYRLSEIGSGVAGMASMLNITRLHNSLAALGYMRRMINLARDYATKRIAFGRLLKDHPLHVATLANMEVECRGSFNFLMYVAALLGKSEANVATPDDLHLLRLLTPLMKLYTAKQAIAISSEGLESFGGQGYIEDTGLPTIFRDSQVLSIWEGTTNVLSLDVLRCIEKSKGDVVKSFNMVIKRTCESVALPDELRPFAKYISKSSSDLTKFMIQHQSLLMDCARDFSFSLCRVFIANLLLDKCVQTKFKAEHVYTLKKWCAQDLTPVLTYLSKNMYDKNSYENDMKIVFDGHPAWKKQ